MAPQRTQTAAEPADAHAGFTVTTADNTLSEALNVLRKRKWVLVITMLLGTVYGFYEAVTQPIRYTASGRIQIGSGATAAYRTSGTGPGDNLSNELLILHSDSLMLTVAQQLDLANNPAFFGVKGPLPHTDINTSPGLRQIIVGTLLASVTTTLIPGTQVMIISCVSPNPKISADVVNHVMDVYIHRSYQVRYDSTQRVTGWLTNQLNDLKAQVEQSQEQLIDMQRKLGVIGLSFDPTHSPNTETSVKVDALSNAVSTARLNSILAQSRYRILLGADPNNLEGMLDASGLDGELSRLRSDIANTNASIAQDSVLRGAANPKLLEEQAHLRELQHEVASEQQRLIEKANDTFLAAKSNEDQTYAALEAAKNEAYEFRDAQVEYSLKQREYETNRSLYEGLLSRLRAAGVQAGLESLEIDIIDRADLPGAPTLKPRSSLMIQSGMFGLVGGIVLAFLLESLDTGLRSVSEIETVTQLPSLAVIPRTRRLGVEGVTLSVAQTNIGVLATSKSQFSEAFRSLRTSLLLATTGHPPKIIVVTSATPAEGKTTVATNLACILAQRETRVLLIDSDLRRPNVHHRFGLNGRVGLSTVLTGSVEFDEAIRTVPEVPNLDILCCGPVPPFPTEMLSSEAMHELLVRSVERYTHIVIDSPPILSVTDGIILARQADALALVVRHGKSSRHVVRRARDLLFRAGAPISGVVLNAVDMNAPEYYGYYGYSGYSYSNIDSESWETEGRPEAKQKETVG